jgi:hypothetical protein
MYDNLKIQFGFGILMSLTVVSRDEPVNVDVERLE